VCLRLKVATVGLLDSGQVRPRQVFADAIADRTTAGIVAHNHPRGTPSRARRIMGIELLDHLTVTKQGLLSAGRAISANACISQ